MTAIVKLLGATAITAAMMLPAMAQDTKQIHMGMMTWEDLTPIAGVTKKVLEDKGYTVEVEEFSEWGIAYAALAKGDIDILTAHTDYVSHDSWEKNRSRLEKISPVSYGLYQAVAVPDYVTINSMEELNGAADKFDGKIIGLEAGSGLMREAAASVEAYGMNDITLIEGSTAAMTAALDAAVSRQEWIAVTLWEPSWMMQKYPMKFLADPKGVFSAPQAYHWIATKGFSEAHPEARDTIAGIFVPLADVTAMNGAVNEGKTMDEAVQGWIDTHGDLLSRWSVN